MKNYLRNHHMAIECSLSVFRCRLCYVASDFGDDRRSKGNVWHKVAVHDIDVQPMGLSKLYVRVLQTQDAAYQSAPFSMVSEHSLPRAPKSAERIEGAMIAGGAMLKYNCRVVQARL